MKLRKKIKHNEEECMNHNCNNCEDCNCNEEKIAIEEHADSNHIRDSYVLVECLKNFEEDAIKANKKIACNGWKVPDVGAHETPRLDAVGDVKYSAFIPSMAVGVDEKTGEHNAVGTLLVNTINDGPIFVSPSENGTQPLCPVVTPTIIGNVNNPFGIYIPFNKHAVEDGLHLVNRVANYMAAEGNNVDLLNCAGAAIMDEYPDNDDADFDPYYDNKNKDIDW